MPSDPDWMSEMEQRVRHARCHRRKAVRRAWHWRSMRAFGSKAGALVRRQFEIEWSNVRHWLVMEQHARGR